MRWRMLRRHLEQEVLVLDELAGAGHAAHRVDPPAAGPGSGADRQVQALAHRRHDSAVRRRHLLAQRRGQEREDESGAEDHRAGNDLDFRKCLACLFTAQPEGAICAFTLATVKLKLKYRGESGVVPS